MQRGSIGHQESLTMVLLDVELELEQMTAEEERLHEQLQDVAQRRAEAEITAKHLRGKLEKLPVVQTDDKSRPQPKSRRVGAPLRSPTGQTLRELALHLLATSDRPITTTMLAQAFDNVEKPKRNRVESARQTLAKLVKEGKAQRLGDKLFVASREAGAPDQT